MLIVDSGPLYASAATRDKNHDRCVQLLRTATRPLIVPELVVTEVAYMLGEHIGVDAEVAFGRSIAAGELLVEPVDEAEWERIVALIEAYADLPLGMVDASVVALAERLDQRQIATLDRRHFTVVRPAHVPTFELLP